ncbi:PLP-dependent aminotransferase family protein [Streptomyces sp. NPDC001137]|uniref:MocR-like transcription factor YczR n=1 Tax=Streptomyces sp. NPDC001137 TaxID=3154378 RepID=UPI003324C4BD
MDGARQAVVPPLGVLLGNWRGTEGSAYRQLAACLLDLVRDGRIPPGTRLPAERRLAADLVVSRTTVTAAYRLLCSSGHAESRHGSGTYTILPSQPAPAAQGGAGVPLRVPPPRRAGQGGVREGGEGVIDLVTASLPAPEPWLPAAVDAAGRELARYAHGHGCFPAGLDELREAVAGRYTRRGVPTDPEQILVTNGATGAFALLLRELTGPFDRVAVESPGHPNLVRAVEAAGARPLPVALCDHGWDVPAWHSALRCAGPRLACLTPDFQQPTGLLMSEDRRRALVALAASTGVTLLVDETLAELSLTPLAPAPTPLAALDPGSSVITVGSAAKTLWSGLRVGWIRATPQLVRTLAVRRAGVDLAPPVLEQLVVRHLLDDARVFADTVAVQRERARTRRDALVAALRTELPDWTFRVPDGGLALWAHAGGRPAREIAALAERDGVRLAAGPRFGTEVHLEGFLRLPFAQPPEVLAEAVRRIAPHGRGPA